MEGRLSMIMFMTLCVAATLHGSSAQTRHVVGNAIGWTIPPGGEVAYRTWAATQTFAVGDTLVFNFTTGFHDVTEVSRTGYDSCNGTSPISRSTNGPTTITLTSAGEHHFICTVPGHCAAGQRLSIDVSGTSPSPAPQPAARTPAPTTSPTPAPRPAVQTPATAPSPAGTATPPPVDAPAPSPSRAGMTYIVGDNMGWTVPRGGPNDYQTWAGRRNFVVGDTLEFNFASGAHDVVEVSRAEFDSCNATTGTTPTTTSPARITLNSTGTHYFICTFTGHCSAGQRLAVNVTAAGPESPPIPFIPGGSPPPTQSDSSATSFAVTALPLFAVALAFLYN